MSKKLSKRKSTSDDDYDDDQSIEDYFDDQLLEDELDFNASLDKKYDKDNESFDRRYRKKFKHKTEDRSTVEGVLDYETSREIYKFQMKGLIDDFDGVVSTGKESNVYYATAKKTAETNGISELAVKIFRTRTLDFKKIRNYIEGDIRFSKSGKKSHQIIQTWALKEYKNLLRAFENGISVPQPFAVKKNILIMQFIGEDRKAAPQLRHVKGLSPDEMQEIYLQIFDHMKLLWTKANLVHADLSAYNILYWQDKIYFIDMGQSVLTEHNFADTFLLRDIENILYYFSVFDVDTQEPEEIFEHITGRIPDTELLKLKK